MCSEEFNVSEIEILRARGPGKFYSPRTTGIRVRDDGALARENRSRSAGAERERLEVLIRRVSIDRACRDPARRGPGESAVSSGDVRLIERDSRPAGLFADIRLSHAWFGNLSVARAWFCDGYSFIEERPTLGVRSDFTSLPRGNTVDGLPRASKSC